MSPQLQHVQGDIAPDKLAAILETDGAAVVHDALTPVQVARSNEELDDAVGSTAPGLRNPSHPIMVEFYGHHTIRLDGLPRRSETFCEILTAPLLAGVADALLLPHCHDYLLNTAQLIQIGPGETPQSLHRDEDAWPFLKPPKPLLEVEAMFALTDFTLENGATRVVPGSHRWPPERTPRPDEIVQAAMPVGSALYYLGTTLHGGGANRTPDTWRRGMFLGFVVGWLRTEENTFLTVPIEQVRDMPVRVQELLGYKPHIAIGVVDVGTPMALLRED